MKYYGLRHKGLGRLACIEMEEEDDEFTIVNSSSSSNKEYLTTNITSLIEVLVENVPRYDSSLERPAYGYRFNIVEYEPVEVEIADPIITRISFDIPFTLNDVFEGEVFMKID